MNSELNFEEVLKEAEEQLEFQYYDSDPEKIYLLLKFADRNEYRPKLVSFIEHGFGTLHRIANEHKPEYEGDKGMINQVMVGTLGTLAGLLGEKNLAPIIYKELIFAGDREQFFELCVESGTLAIALCALDYDGDLADLINVQNTWKKIYGDELSFVLKLNYAYWVLSKNAAFAMEYLADSKHTRNLAYVATALADLDAKDSLSLLKEKLVAIKNFITKEAFLEAISRLEIQEGPPSAKHRMIWLFGKKSDTELVLGNETDNEFIIRARRKIGNEELGMVYEADASLGPDI